jgi:hypothetical protein
MTLPFRRINSDTESRISPLERIVEALTINESAVTPSPSDMNTSLPDSIQIF